MRSSVLPPSIRSGPDYMKHVLRWILLWFGAMKIRFNWINNQIFILQTIIADAKHSPGLDWICNLVWHKLQIITGRILTNWFPDLLTMKIMVVACCLRLNPWLEINILLYVLVIWVNWPFKIFHEHLWTTFIKLLILQPKCKPGDDESDEKCWWAGMGGGDEPNECTKAPSRDFSNPVRQPSLPAWSKAPGCPFSLLWPRSAVHHCHKPSVWWMCDLLSHVHSHTRPAAVHNTILSVLSFSSSVYTHIEFHICSAHTHTLKVHGTFCVAPVSAAGSYSPFCPSPLMLSWSSLWWVSPAPGPGELGWAGGCCSRSYRRGWARTAAGLALGSSGRSSWHRTRYRSSCRETEKSLVDSQIMLLYT